MWTVCANSEQDIKLRLKRNPFKGLKCRQGGTGRGTAALLFEDD
jgi:hypothetical protein